MARAWMCDKCGKVVLLSDNVRAVDAAEEGLYRMTCVTTGEIGVDLCEECYEELLEAVRRGREGAKHA